MTRLRLYIGITVLLFLSALSLIAQENIGLGEWRMHVSYNNVKSVSVGLNKIFAASKNGVIVVDKGDKSTSTFDRLNVLSNAGIEVIGYDDSQASLIVAYNDGTFDVIKNNEGRSFDPSENTVLTGSKIIHGISFRDDLAYLSTDYGVLIFDLIRSEIKETWRDLGIGGTTLKILGSSFYQDSIFLATEKGILAGDLDDNLLDFNNWKRMAGGDLNREVNFITTFKNLIYAGMNGLGIYRYENNVWSKKDFFATDSFTSMTASENQLIISEMGKVWMIAQDETVLSVSHPLMTSIMYAAMDDSGKLWIGDRMNGLLTDKFGAFESIIPNGPASDTTFNLTYFNNRMYSVSGGFNGNLPLLHSGTISYFENGRWSSENLPVTDLTSVAFNAEGKMFASSFGYGVLDNVSGTLYDETNSTLVNLAPPSRRVLISALHQSAEGLWVANYGTLSSLHLLDMQGQWESFAFPFSAAQYPLKLLTDFENNVWMQLNPASGGGLLVFNKLESESLLLTEADGGGELPTNSVYSIALDRDGYVWVGTDAGVAYFYDEESDAVKPIFENRFLLRDEKVTAIAVDGGNRKWMGTERGVWLFNASGEAAIANFTTTNSPLLSDKIVDIEIDPATGEVFFSTDKGLISFRSDATQSRIVFDDVKIFPNPVENTFTGHVGISGLATDAIVKITDVSGKLIFQTVANGGTASWDVTDYNGRRVPTGVFLVFAINSDGSESVVGKIAVIN
jgi:hypothetical protein